MPALIITSKDHLTAWLEERNWLDMSHVRKLSPPPRSPDVSSVNNEVTFRLEVWVRGSLYAGDPLQFEEHDVQATGVTIWSAFESDSYTDETYVHDLELDDSSDRLKLIFDDDLVLECT